MQPDQQLRPFSAEGEAIQRRVTAEIVDAALKGEDILFVGPTGCGKTKIFTDALVTLAAKSPDFNALVLQRRRHLAQQNEARAHLYGVSPDNTHVVMDGEIHPDAASRPFIYALPQTLAGRTAEIGPRRYVVLDEAHHAGDDDGTELNSVIQDLEAANPNVAFLGATASPYPPKGQKFCARLENARRITITYHEAIEAGMITGIRTETPDYRLKDGSYIHQAIEAKIDDRRVADTRAGITTMIGRLRPPDFPDMVARDIVRNGEQTMPTLCFADTIAEAEKLQHAFLEQGIKAAVIHSRMPESAVVANVKAYLRGDITHLASVDMIGEGFDAPHTTRIIQTKALTTLDEEIQARGRAQRIFGSSHDRVYRDYGASTAIHGTMEEYVKAQQYVLRGGPNDAWTKMQKDPFVQGICLGKDVLYAVATLDQNSRPGYSVMRSYTDTKTETRRLDHIPDPGTGAKIMSRKQLDTFTRKAIIANETDYIRLRSRRQKITLPGGETRTVPVKNIILSQIWKAQKDAALMMARGSPVSDRQFVEAIVAARENPQKTRIPQTAVAAAAKTRRQSQGFGLGS
ncbi:hypothetical protein GCM10019059_36790 [Camelimonas fluminis]|uniref:DEAD/DEAH box helicase n=1 Tax=Camelimonas fluminis TaxID=1576911 RepID=A0ABV7UHZ2_9HYPH|nr:DEAD/DEAH box helicase [Camelimonas fluminis]GHE73886.1 hypothetical protein GCM10019059_36790 [Camelimonas fluminis]